MAKGANRERLPHQGRQLEGGHRTGSSPSGSPGGPAKAIANVNAGQVERPVYFQYPSGFPMVPFKRSDGAVAADIAGDVFPTAVSVYSPC